MATWSSPVTRILCAYKACAAQTQRTQAVCGFGRASLRSRRRENSSAQEPAFLADDRNLGKPRAFSIVRRIVDVEPAHVIVAHAFHRQHEFFPGEARTGSPETLNQHFRRNETFQAQIGHGFDLCLLKSVAVFLDHRRTDAPRIRHHLRYPNAAAIRAHFLDEGLRTVHRQRDELWIKAGLSRLLDTFRRRLRRRDNHHGLGSGRSNQLDGFSHQRTLVVKGPFRDRTQPALGKLVPDSGQTILAKRVVAVHDRNSGHAEGCQLFDDPGRFVLIFCAHKKNVAIEWFVHGLRASDGRNQRNFGGRQNGHGRLGGRRAAIEKERENLVVLYERFGISHCTLAIVTIVERLENHLSSVDPALPVHRVQIRLRTRRRLLDGTGQYVRKVGGLTDENALVANSRLGKGYAGSQKQNGRAHGTHHGTK